MCIVPALLITSEHHSQTGAPSNGVDSQAMSPREGPPRGSSLSKVSGWREELRERVRKDQEMAERRLASLESPSWRARLDAVKAQMEDSSMKVEIAEQVSMLIQYDRWSHAVHDHSERPRRLRLRLVGDETCSTDYAGRAEIKHFARQCTATLARGHARADSWPSCRAAAGKTSVAFMSAIPENCARH